MTYRVFGFGIAVLCVLACAALGFPGRADDANPSGSLEPQGIELRAPSNPSLLVDIPSYRPPPAAGADDLRVLAYEYSAHVYAQPSAKRRTIGFVRRGTVLRATKRVTGHGCKRGTWYALPGNGYACAGRGFTTYLENPRHQRRPDVSRPLPFEYGRVNSRSALRFFRIPELTEERAIARALAAGTGKFPEVVAQQLNGDYFVAIDRLEKAGKRQFYRTVLGRYLRSTDVDLKPEPGLRGELLSGSKRLPIAFVYGEPTSPVLAKRSGRVEPVGTAHRHARFAVERTARWDGQEVVVGPRDLAVAREHVRIARKRPPPSGVPRGWKWIHVDLDEQTLVAYRGNAPVFATLVTTGKEGYETPTGLFRISEKHTTTTMRGHDPVDGPYEVAEVPWTMYYSGSYALHGAYWHNDFGKVRSHGCTNLSPIDARWLFQFTAGELPPGWHARRRLEGTYVYLTRDG